MAEVAEKYKGEISESTPVTSHETNLPFCSAENETAAARITAKSGFESYIYSFRDSLSDDKLADKFDAVDKTKLETAVNDAIEWLDISQECSEVELEKIRRICRPFPRRFLFFLGFELVFYAVL